MYLTQHVPHKYNSSKDWMCGSDPYFQSEWSVNRIRATNEIYGRCVKNQPQDQCHGVGLKACQPGPLTFFLSQQSNKTYSCHAATESCYIFKPPTSSVSVSFFNLESRVLIDLSVMWHDCNRDNQQLAGKKIVFLFSSPLLWGVSQSSVGDGCSHQFYRLLSFEGFLVTPDLLLQCAQVDNLDFVFYWFCSIGT